MRVAITGASGFIGSALVSHLEQGGHEVMRLVRDRARVTNRAVHWDPAQGIVDTDGLEGVEAVVHLAGESIASSRWSEAQKRRILESRTVGTDVLATALAGMDAPPAVLLSGSAIGYYGDRGDEVLTEDSAPGSGFLAEVCKAWEAATAPAQGAGIRVVHARTGIVLDDDGGALQKMLLPFRLGAGGRIGDGSQYMSWISLRDHVRGLEHLLAADVAGPVNLTGPTPVDNATFTAALGEVLRRPTVVPVPAFAIRTALGEMGEALLLESQRVVPQRLLDDGFTFEHGDVTSALRWSVNG